MRPRSLKSGILPLALGGLFFGCSSAETDPASGDGDGAQVGGGGGGPGSGGATDGGGGADGGGTPASGGVIDSSTGGGAIIPGDGGAPMGAGGLDGGTGGNPVAVVDCSLITAAGYEVCEENSDSCAAVFSDGSGCGAVCAAAGLECEGAHENVEGVCAADSTLPAVPCESGHQSDYCLCGGELAGTGGAGSGGAAGTGGSDGSGGSGGTSGSGAPDCNSVSDQPIVDVNKDGSGDFATVQSAVNSISGSNSTPTIIRIAPGSYYEKLIVDRPKITLCGQLGQEENTILTYSDGADTGGVGTTGSASVNLSGDDVSVDNITFENTRGVGSQAVALLVSGNRVQFRNSRFIGHQDTLYVRGGPLYFRDCYVEGTVDFIFGDATAILEDCTIHSVGGGTAITAPSTDQANPYGIVFLGGELTAVGSVSNGSVALGRNWRPYGSTTYIGTHLGAHISGVGWVKMGENELSTARFSEHQTTGPGANPGARAPESSQLSSGEAANFTVDNILGDWTPSYSE